MATAKRTHSVMLTRGQRETERVNGKIVKLIATNAIGSSAGTAAASSWVNRKFICSFRLFFPRRFLHKSHHQIRVSWVDFFLFARRSKACTHNVRHESTRNRKKRSEWSKPFWCSSNLFIRNKATGKRVENKTLWNGSVGIACVYFWYAIYASVHTHTQSEYARASTNSP